eukprot:6197444-Pleurochrysis_carterae.AAC.1
MGASSSSATTASQNGMCSPGPASAVPSNTSSGGRMQIMLPSASTGTSFAPTRAVPSMLLVADAPLMAFVYLLDSKYHDYKEFEQGQHHFMDAACLHSIVLAETEKTKHHEVAIAMRIPDGRPGRGRLEPAGSTGAS